MIHIVYPQPSLHRPRRVAYVPLADPFFGGYDSTVPEYDYDPYVPRHSPSPVDFDFLPFASRTSPEMYPIGGPATMLNPFFAAATPGRSQSVPTSCAPVNRLRRQPTLHRRNAIRRRSEDDELQYDSAEAYLRARAEAEAQARIDADRREIERAREAERQREAVRREHQQRLQREVERKKTLTMKALEELISALTGEEVSLEQGNAAAPSQVPSAAPKTEMKKPKVKFAEPVEQAAPTPAVAVTSPAPAKPQAPSNADGPKSASSAPEPERAPSPAKDVSLERVSAISAHLTNLIHTFALPRYLTFEPTSTPAPHLSYAPQNAPVHAYEESLNGIIADLDGIESEGDEEVRKARRDIVRRAERELKWLEEEVRRAWERDNAPEPTEPSQPEPTAETEEDEFKATKEVLADFLGHHVEEAAPKASSAVPVAEAVVPAVETVPTVEASTVSESTAPAAETIPAAVEESSVTPASADVESLPVVEAESVAPVAPLVDRALPISEEFSPAEQAETSEQPIVPAVVELPTAELFERGRVEGEEPSEHIREVEADEDEGEEDYEGHELESVPESDQEGKEDRPPFPALPEQKPATAVIELDTVAREESPVASPLLQGAFVDVPAAGDVRKEKEEEDRKEVLSEEEESVDVTGTATEESEYEMI